MLMKIEGRNVFLSGRMSDDPVTFHAHEFIDAHIKLKAKGAKCVYDPAIEWLCDQSGEQSHTYWMRRCVSELTRPDMAYLDVADPSSLPRLKYDLLISLPGWRASAGATTERHVAGALGIPCVDWDEVDTEYRGYRDPLVEMMNQVITDYLVCADDKHNLFHEMHQGKFSVYKPEESTILGRIGETLDGIRIKRCLEELKKMGIEI